MKQICVMMGLILALTSISLHAQEEAPPSAPVTTDDRGKNIEGTNASGNNQTTIIDESGNLKVIDKSAAPSSSNSSPSQESPSSSPTPSPNMTSPPIDSNLNTEQHVITPTAPPVQTPQGSPGSY